MIATDRVRIRPVADDEQTHRAHVLLDGVETPGVVGGVHFECAFQLAEAWLLFTTYDTPFEEGLRISLLDTAGEPVDWVELSAPYSTGRLQGVDVQDESMVLFRFWDDRPWELVVHPRPTMRLPFPFPAGVSRRGLFHGRLSLRRTRPREGREAPVAARRPGPEPRRPQQS